MACPAGLFTGTGLNGPYSASICYLRSAFGTMPDGHTLFRLGTGAIMNSDATGTYVLTAAHNLYINATGQSSSSIEVWFGCSGPTSQSYQVTTHFRFPDAFKTPRYDPRNDFAVIWVPTLSTATFPPIGLFMSGNPQSVRLIGYPVEGGCAGTRQPYHADFVATPNDADTLDYDQLTYEGMSGGPLITIHSTGLMSCGVHLQGTGPNRAVKVSSNMASQLSQWVK